jgi:putative PIN family toxin of toxin-antitoxin system
LIVVLDANVLAAGLSSLERSDSKPAAIIQRWFAGEIEVVLSMHLADELRRTLNKRYFRRAPSANEHARLIGMVERLAQMVEIEEVVPGVAPHRHDDPVLATVAASEADWFVTGDAALLAMGSYAGVPFVDPARFLKELDAGAG